jgi:hypothetical protein
VASVHIVTIKAPHQIGASAFGRLTPLQNTAFVGLIWINEKLRSYTILACSK